jgi:hypothetical protein
MDNWGFGHCGYSFAEPEVNRYLGLGPRLEEQFVMMLDV